MLFFSGSGCDYDGAMVLGGRACVVRLCGLLRVLLVACDCVLWDGVGAVIRPVELTRTRTRVVSALRFRFLLLLLDQLDFGHSRPRSMSPGAGLSVCSLPVHTAGGGNATQSSFSLPHFRTRQ